MLVPAIHMSNIEKIVIDAVKAAQNRGSPGSSPETTISQPSTNPPKLESLSSSGSATTDEFMKASKRNRTSMEDEDSHNGKKGSKRSRDEKTEEELHEERKAANRRSAYQSRLRKKLLIEELQGKVDNLTQQLNTMKEEKKSLQVQLESALAENRQLRFDQQAIIMSAGGGTTAGPGFGLMGGNPTPFANFGTANIPTATTSNPSVAALLSELQQQQQQQQQQNRAGDNIGAGHLARQFRGPL